MYCNTCVGYDMIRTCPKNDACPYLHGVLEYNADTRHFGLKRFGEWKIAAIELGQPLEVFFEGEWYKTSMYKRYEDNEEGLWCLKNTNFEELAAYPFNLQGATVRFHR